MPRRFARVSGDSDAWETLPLETAGQTANGYRLRAAMPLDATRRFFRLELTATDAGAGPL